jgi:predicted TIM-barrel fold metal-dependent hydrolase
VTKFVFSADSHVMEPENLFLDGLPASLKKHAVRARREDEYIITGTDDKVIYRLRIGKKNEGELGDRRRRGLREIPGRLLDMELDGIDAEICFPSLGLWLYCLDDADAEAASAQVYNDWNHQHFQGHLEKFVRCGVLPVQTFDHTLTEMRRLAGLGFTAAMLPSVTPGGVPKYNDEAWDPIFNLGGELGIVFVLHTGTGLESVVQERGNGAAVINYTLQLSDASRSCMYLVAGGVLDRNPKAKVAFIESGASWLAGIAERMDEVYAAHHHFVRPKLTCKPSEIIQRQVFVSFQHDRACIMARSVTGAHNIMWASDYPHAEGTFPRSRDVIAGLFSGIDIPERDQRMILGGNAAKLFRLENSAVADLVAA